MRLAGWATRSNASMPEGALRSLVVDGVIGGVGAVVIFLPQILILFFFIALLEDCGYMARAAFLMDRLMAGVGLSGKSFIPLLSSFACAIPGIMATRVIENRRDRLATILIAPLMSCSARLPVYVILIGAFVPATRYLGGLVGLQGLVLLAMYSVGVVAAIGVAWLLKKTMLRGETPPFVLELPSYKLPSLRTVAFRMAERGWAFFARAGTVIFAVTIVIWALAYYPRSDEQVRPTSAAERTRLEANIAAVPPTRQPSPPRPPNLPRSTTRKISTTSRPVCTSATAFLGRAGQLIEPVVRPLGWDWRIGCAAIASFPAREVVMGVLGVIYQLGPDVDVGDESDQSRCSSTSGRPLGRHRRTGVQFAGGAVDHGVFRVVCPVCRDAGRDPPRNQQLALAGVHVRVHDGAGVHRRADHLPVGIRIVVIAFKHDARHPRHPDRRDRRELPGPPRLATLRPPARRRLRFMPQLQCERFTAIPSHSSPFRQSCLTQRRRAAEKL